MGKQEKREIQVAVDVRGKRWQQVVNEAGQQIRAALAAMPKRFKEEGMFQLSLKAYTLYGDQAAAAYSVHELSRNEWALQFNPGSSKSAPLRKPADAVRHTPLTQLDVITPGDEVYKMGEGWRPVPYQHIGKVKSEVARWHIKMRRLEKGGAS